MTDQEIAHANQMSADMGPEQDDTEIERTRADTAPTYKEDASNDPPTYDPKEAEASPEYESQQSLGDSIGGD